MRACCRERRGETSVAVGMGEREDEGEEGEGGGGGGRGVRRDAEGTMWTR